MCACASTNDIMHVRTSPGDFDQKIGPFGLSQHGDPYYIVATFWQRLDRTSRCDQSGYNHGLRLQLTAEIRQLSAVLDEDTVYSSQAQGIQGPPAFSSS